MGGDAAFGEKAINKLKDAEEGCFSRQQTVWGLTINAETERMSLPEARILKGAYLLAQPCFNYGHKDLPLKEFQTFRGIATGWSTVVAGLKNELKSADGFLGGMDGRAAVRPRLMREDGSEAANQEELQAWEALWELFEDCRWLCSRSETSVEKFGGDHQGTTASSRTASTSRTARWRAGLRVIRCDTRCGGSHRLDQWARLPGGGRDAETLDQTGRCSRGPRGPEAGHPPGRDAELRRLCL